MPRIAVSIKAESRYCVSGMTVQNRPEYLAWQKTTNAIALEIENPRCVFKRVQDIYNYFEQI